MKILKSSISLLLVLGGGISLTSYLTSCSCSNSTPTPTPAPSEKPIPFTDEYFTWTTSGDELTVAGLQNNVDLSGYDTLSIPATCVIGGVEYRVTAIARQAFRSYFSPDSSYSNIIHLNLNNASNLNVIYGLAFMTCSSLTGSLTIPNSVTNIDEDAFARCYGFNGTLTISNSVTNIEEDAFYDTKFTDVINYSPNFNFADNVGNAKVLIPASSGTSLDYVNGSIVANIAFGQLTIPDSVTSIGEDLFSGCSGLTGSLIIPDSVTSIGESAFGECYGLTGSLTIGNSVTLIDEDAFSQCSGFTGSLTIPNSVISIGSWAFSYCWGFDGSLIIGNSVTDIDSYAFFYCSGFNGTLTIGNSVTSIGGAAFSRTRFTNVINNSPSFNLADNVGNAKVLIPASSGTSLDYENGSVVGCIAFDQLTIPNSVTSLLRWLFYDCSGLTGSLTIPDSVTSIGDYAFFYCSGFTGSLTIPDSVTSIGANAFGICSGFNVINVVNWTDVPTIGLDSFGQFNSEGGTVIVPAGLGITLSTFDGLPSTWSLQEV